MPKKSKKPSSDHYVLLRLKRLPWAIIAIVAGIVLFTNMAVGTVAAYNQMVSLRNTANASWQQVEIQYQRRFDLIPNLVSAVKGAQIQEKEIFGQIAEARARYGAAVSTDDKAAAASGLDSAISRLLVISESYPELTSNQLIQGLQAELVGTENKISVARTYYNDDVRTYNTYIQVFPNNIVAKTFSFKDKVYFESSIEAHIAPEVNIR